MIESIAIGILFIAAVVYLVTLLKRNFGVKDGGCVKGCGTCNQPAVKSGKNGTSKAAARV